MSSRQTSLVVLGCSATKFQVEGQVPAVHLYDGPMYRVLRSRLRTHKWSKDLSIGVLSTKYGLIGAVAPIETYDQRMTMDRAASLRARVTESLTTLAEKHQRIHLVLGQDYLAAVDQYCRIVCQLPDDEEPREMLSCNFIVMPGMEILELSQELKWCLRAKLPAEAAASR